MQILRMLSIGLVLVGAGWLPSAYFQGGVLVCLFKSPWSPWYHAFWELIDYPCGCSVLKGQLQGSEISADLSSRCLHLQCIGHAKPCSLLRITFKHLYRVKQLKWKLGKCLAGPFVCLWFLSAPLFRIQYCHSRFAKGLASVGTVLRFTVARCKALACQQEHAQGPRL